MPGVRRVRWVLAECPLGSAGSPAVLRLPRAAIGVAALEGVLATATRLPWEERTAFVGSAVPVAVPGLREHT